MIGVMRNLAVAALIGSILGVATLAPAQGLRWKKTDCRWHIREIDRGIHNAKAARKWREVRNLKSQRAAWVQRLAHLNSY